MSEEIIRGMPDSPYYQNPEVRKEIDAALERSAILRTKVGTRQLKDANGKLIDDMGTDAAKLWVKEQENRILGDVYDLDPEFVDLLMYDEDTLDI